MAPRSSFSVALLLAGCASSSTPDSPVADGSSGSSSAADSADPSGADAAGDGAATSSGAGPTSTTDGSSGIAESEGAGEDSSGGVDDCDPRGEGTNYAQREYETEDPEELFVDPVGTSTYVQGACWESTSCWQVNPIGTNGNEDHAGWNTAMLPDLADGGTQTMFVGHLLYVSGGMIDAMENHAVSGKMLDAYQHDLPDGYGPTRQTVMWSYWNPEHPGPDFVDTAASGIVPRLAKGGAGGNYVRQIGAVPFDLRDYADQWIWMEFEFNAAERYTKMWVKTQDGVFSGAHCEPIMWRSADVPEDWVHEYWVEDPYEYRDDTGWATPGLAWGYWDDLDNKPLDADDFVRLDHMVVSDTWIVPPF